MPPFKILSAINALPRNIECAFKWGYDELISSRTLAKNALLYKIDIPDELGMLAESLLNSISSDLYPSGGISTIEHAKDLKHNAQLENISVTAAEICAKALDISPTDIIGLNFASCREQSFHHDDVMADQHVYLALVLAHSIPLAFHTMGASTVISPGDLLVFDPKHPHALIREGANSFVQVKFNDLSHRFVFALASVLLRPKLRQLLGIRVKRPRKNFIEMRHVNYCETTGEYLK